jgi:hypothetical protein
MLPVIMREIIVPENAVVYYISRSIDYDMNFAVQSIILLNLKTEEAKLREVATTILWSFCFDFNHV